MSQVRSIKDLPQIPPFAVEPTDFVVRLNPIGSVDKYQPASVLLDEIERLKRERDAMRRRLELNGIQLPEISDTP